VSNFIKREKAIGGVFVLNVINPECRTMTAKKGRAIEGMLLKSAADHFLRGGWG